MKGIASHDGLQVQCGGENMTRNDSYQKREAMQECISMLKGGQRHHKEKYMKAVRVTVLNKLIAQGW